MTWFRLALGGVFVVGGCMAARAPLPSAAAANPPGSEWVERTLSQLDLRQKLAQLVFPRIGGEYMAEGSPAHEQLKLWVRDLGVGGVIITIGPPLEMAAKLNMLQELASVPVLVTADLEHGPGQGLQGGTVLPYGLETGGATIFPPAMALGATGDERLAWEVGRITALEGRAAGVHLTFSPVVDVNNNPANPIINTRSLGADPELVARLATAQVRGLQDHGMLAAAKHFPGHGDTHIDSHVSLPVITVDRQRADRVELLPYRAAFSAGVGAVMSAHISFPALSGDSLPATLNPRLLTGLLREELGFDGLVFTDAMDMGAIINGWGRERAPVLALKAGADVLLQVFPDDVPRVIDALVAAVQSGELSESAIDASVRRLLAVKARLGLPSGTRVDLDRLPQTLGKPEHVAVAADIAQRSITAVRDRDTLLPVSGGRVLSVVYTDDYDPWAGRVLQRELATALPGLATAALTERASATELTALRARADSADLVLFSPFIRVRAYKGALMLPEAVAQWLRELASARPVVVTSFGNPYVLQQLPELSTYLLAWGSAAASQRAAARALTGHAPITGRLPIAIPPLHQIGDGLQLPANGAANGLSLVAPGTVGMDAATLDTLDALIERALASGAAPGAALAVGRHGRLVMLRGYGQLEPGRPGLAVTDSTIYDLASLTKVIATTSAVMLLVDRGLLDLDAPVARYLDAWQESGPRAAVTIRNLMLHNAGLPAFKAWYRTTRGRTEFRQALGTLELEYAPGTRTVYSDLGFITLGLIVEQVSGKPLDAFLQRELFGPLGLRETGFSPLTPPAPGAAIPAVRAPWPLARIAPTELDTILRHRRIHGVVHDENAYALGGVSGHAGLFSSARDLAVIAQLLLNGGEYGGRRYLQEGTVHAFTRRQSDASSRALGWDTPSASSSAGDLFSAGSFGHTGFTGTSVWVDPERDVFVVLLTNRVYDGRENQRHVPLRREVADAVQRAIRDLPVAPRAAGR